MSVRKITKSERINIVTWIRSGAPLSEGVSLYASLPHNPRLLTVLQKKPEAYEQELVLDLCMLLGITYPKFQSIIEKYHGKKIISNNAPGNITQEVERKDRQPKKSRSFRNDWPFLSQPECPPELKALAADKISCWERYTANHQKLFDCSTMEECAEVAHEIIKNYKENRLIYQELEHYQKHGAILGLHPVFKHYKRFKELRNLNVIQLIKEQERIKHRIWRKKSEIEKGDKPHLKAKRELSLKEAESELAEINRMLGVNG